MFLYAKDVSLMAQDIIKNYCTNFNVAVDCTLGNGYDTDFLCKTFKTVYSFDIQKSAIDNYKNKNISNVILIEDSHSKIKEYLGHIKADCFMYNLGFLPGGDKTITTKAEFSLESIKQALGNLNSKGIISICLYIGHKAGKQEEEILLPFLQSLDKSKYAITLHTFLNRSESAPLLIVIEKK
ncbi:class I SAM-dependent methyltransferase [Hathewaya histolytica]|uniref:rRNA methylase n=1 Tax=Hathewaya histolytica TaxID=1498 RepID=A0A4U9RCK4_HATHI|nr:class I SAM-dependent methyltransferase [Hathewaya histolytica]VTQ89444.1 rRNA methylase [Hathewaya histolytica]